MLFKSRNSHFDLLGVDLNIDAVRWSSFPCKALMIKLVFPRFQEKNVILLCEVVQLVCVCVTFIHRLNCIPHVFDGTHTWNYVYHYGAHI